MRDGFICADQKATGQRLCYCYSCYSCYTTYGISGKSSKYSNNSSSNRKEERDSARAELISLVRFIADFHGFTEEDHDEALAIALADFDDALICFRALKQDALSMGSSTRLKPAGNTYPSPEAKGLNLERLDARGETA